jgi:hypothetical protein
MKLGSGKTIADAPTSNCLAAAKFVGVRTEILHHSPFPSHGRQALYEYFTKWRRERVEVGQIAAPALRQPAAARRKSRAAAHQEKSEASR